MPVLAIVGAKDALLDSAETRCRIERLLDSGEVRHLNDAGHLILGQGPIIAEFLNSRRLRTPAVVRLTG
jgi:pimeloyl-ACP methyl ester carboxylesterase